MSDLQKYARCMDIKSKVYDAIKHAKNPDFTLSELYEIAHVFENEATILKHKIEFDWFKYHNNAGAP